MSFIEFMRVCRGCRAAGMALAFLFISFPAQAADSEQVWLMGNLHCHSDRSHDADSPVEEVIQWYLDHQYDFIAVADHDIAPEVSGIVESGDRRILVLPAVEISAAGHISGINLKDYSAGDQTEAYKEVRDKIQPAPMAGKTRRFKFEDDAWISSETAAFQQLTTKIINDILEQGGLPVFNHPYLFTSAFIMNVSEKLKHMEIWNRAIEGELVKMILQNPEQSEVNYRDPSNLEEKWDDILSTGRIFYGIAVDDAHNFKRRLEPEALRNGQRFLSPGRAWVMVRAEELSAESILEALNNGNFYATSGTLLESVRYEPGKFLSVKVQAADGAKYRIHFIGKDGRILKEVIGTSASYSIQPEDLYVRAKVYGFYSRFAWTQPVFPALPDQPYQD